MKGGTKDMVDLHQSRISEGEGRAAICGGGSCNLIVKCLASLNILDNA